jgi:hypothetical protein
MVHDTFVVVARKIRVDPHNIRKSQQHDQIEMCAQQYLHSQKITVIRSSSNSTTDQRSLYKRPFLAVQSRITFSVQLSRITIASRLSMSFYSSNKLN